MFPVTKEFKDKILQNPRKVFGKVQIDYSDPFIDQSITVLTSENANISYPKQTADGIQDIRSKIASLDGSWVLDGTWTLAPSYADELVQMGWWGNQLSGVSGNFASPYPSLSVNFLERPIVSLKVVGDNQRQEYPVNFTIDLLNTDNVILHTETIVGNTSIVWEKNLSSAITQVASILLTITKWSHSGRQAKICEFYTMIQEVYEGKDLISFNLLEEMVANSNSLPIGTVSSNDFSLKLSNKTKKFDAGNTQSPLYGQLKANRRIKAWLGIERDDLTKEFVPLGTFWSKDWDVPSNGVHAATSGWDRLSFLTGTYTSGEMTNVTLYDLTADLFSHAGLSPEEYWIDTELQDYIIPYVNLVDIQYKEVLRKIAEVCLGNVYCDRLGIIKVQGSREASNVYNISTSEDANISYPNQVTDKIEVPDGIYCLLDGSWSLDGSQELAPEIESKQMGWYSEQLSDAQGYFNQTYPTLTITFDVKAIESIKIVGDSLRNEYPVDFTIVVYDSSDNILSNQVIVGNTELNTSIEIPENPTNATKVSLFVQRWSKPNTQAKIVEFIDVLYILNIEPKDTFKKNNPAKYSEVANYIEVSVQPFDSAGVKLPITKVIVSDEDSITENGLLKYSLPVNDLIQTEEVATNVANRLLTSFKNPNRSLELEWRGHPALLLRDTISVVDSKETNQYRVVRQELSYDGSLRAKLTGRRL